MSFHDLEVLIKANRGDAVEFGDSSCDLNPTPARVAETEERIGAKLPPSYIWFVLNYGGGEVYGEEIFSIYKAFREESVGDVGVSTVRYRKSGFIEDSEVAICSNDFGEIFVFDTKHPDQDGEYPVMIKRGGLKQLYAINFADFLVKRIGNPDLVKSMS